MPLRLDTLIGQTAAVEELAQRVAADRLPHALLFEGPDGVGKTTAAEALAGLLVCKSPDRLGACGRCPSCAKLDAGAHADVRRIRPNEKGNVVVDSIRELERQILLRPLEGLRKVALIPEAHRMTPGAQNALLKTLEEPPIGTYLVLVTDRPQQALLPTVLSRCQRVRFRPLSRDEVAQVMKREAKDRTADERDLLAALAEGSPGRALGLDLDGLLDRREQVQDLDERLDPRSPRAPIEAIDAAAELGRDRDALRALLDTWASWARDQALLASGLDDDALTHRDCASALRALAERRGLESALARADALLEARRQLDLPFNLNGVMVAEQTFLTLAGQLPLRRVPYHPNVGRGA